MLTYNFKIMKQANFILGFSNWGKSTLIHELFGKTVFQRNKLYKLKLNKIEANFVVQSQSNDDLGINYLEQVSYRINQTRGQKRDLFTTICPALEDRYNCIAILRNPIFNEFKKFNFFILKHKWDHQAELKIEAIKSTLQILPKAVFHVIDADESLPLENRLNTKLGQIQNILISSY